MLLNKPPDFFRRLRFYVFGFLLGCVLVYFVLLRGKDRTGWLPERRVIEKIDSTLSLTSPMKCLMDCDSISTADLHAIIKGSDVDFGESITQKKPFRMYVLKGKLRTGEEIKMNFDVCDSASILTKISIPAFENKSRTCPCN